MLDEPMNNSARNGGPHVPMTLREWLEADTRVPHKRARRKALEVIASLATSSPDERLIEVQIIAQTLWEKVGPTITAARAAEIAQDIHTALEVRRRG